MDYKLTPEQRDEVNALIEHAQDDLEGVLYHVVGQREEMREALKFYADHQTYGLHGGSAKTIYCDAGKRARDALANAKIAHAGDGQPSK